MMEHKMEHVKYVKKQGISLIETMIALTVFAAFTTGACKVFAASRRINDLARGHYVAANLAKNRLEVVRAFPFDQLLSFEESMVIVDVNGDNDVTGNFCRTTDVNVVNSNLYEVVVSVNLKNRKTLEFDSEPEVVRSYFSEHLEPE